MKKLSILLVLILLITGISAKSQNGDRFPLLRERILQAKLREIKLKLNVDPGTFEKFRPIYLKYNQELSEIELFKLGRMMKINSDSISGEQAEQMILHQMESARKIISIREKYYKEFKTVLTPQQILKLYQTEAEIRNKVTEEMKRRRLNRQ